MVANKKSQYVPPRWRDLSALTVSGAQCNPGVSPIDISGSCESGSALTSGECAAGTTPVGGTCSPTGFIPQRGYCRTGGQAVEGCYPTGSIHH